MAIRGRFQVSMEDVFPHGAFVVSEVEPIRDFDQSTRERFVQQLDKETGQPLWSVSVLDGDPEARRNEKTVTVKIAAPHQPVPPEAAAGLPFRPVEFEGLSVMPYGDDKACTGPKPGQSHRCRARVAFSIRASGMRAPGKRQPGPTGEGKAA